MENCKVIAIASQKSGVGKTTTTLKLGVALSKLGKKVLLIVADPQGDLTTCMGYYETDDIPAIATLMDATINDKDFYSENLILHHEENVDLMPSNFDLSAVAVSLVNAMSREYIYQEYLKNNIVFVGFDDKETPRYAFVRGTNSRFMHDAYGSDKSYSFKLNSIIKKNTVIYLKGQ